MSKEIEHETLLNMDKEELLRQLMMVGYYTPLPTSYGIHESYTKEEVRTFSAKRLRNILSQHLVCLTNGKYLIFNPSLVDL